MRILLLAVALLATACGDARAAAPAPALPAPAATAAPAAEAMPAPEATASPDPAAAAPTAAPEPAAAAPAPPAAVAVGFSGLPAGTYPVHLHAICSGAQGYHLAYLPSLAVGPAGTGAISVPSQDTGRGWCLIVYANAALTRVLATRPA